jgi:hypothetical protein
MTIVIWGKYQNEAPEEIDETENKAGALFLVQQYRVAYGPDWKIWAAGQHRRKKGG